MNLSSPMMIWSSSSMDSNLHAAANRSVISMSSGLGVGSPDGWGWQQMIEAELLRIAVFMTSRGYTRLALRLPTWTVEMFVG